MSKEQTWLKSIAGIAVFAWLYYTAARLGLLFHEKESVLFPLWMSSGAALAVVLLFGWRLWPGVWLGMFAVNLTGIEGIHAGSLWSQLGMDALIATGTTLMAVAGFSLCARCSAGRAGAFWRGPLFVEINLFRFSTIALGICIISALFGTTTLCAYGLAPWGEFPLLWFTWWLGDVTGVLIVTPFLLAWSQSSKEGCSLRILVESILAIGLLFVISRVVYSGWFSSGGRALPLGFLAIAPLAWVALRCGPRATTTAVLLLAILATWHTAHHLGPLVIATDLGSLLMLLSFLIAVAIPSHALESDSTARRKAEAEVKALNESLERRVNERMLELERSYQRYQLLAANLPNGAVFLFNEDLRLIVADGMALKKCGTSKVFMEGKTLWEAFPAEVAVALEPHFRLALAGNAEIFEQTLADCDFLVFTLPVRDAQGGVFAGMAMCQDITERKLAEEELLNSEERFNAFMRNLPGVAFMKDLEGRYIYASDRVDTVTGLSAIEVMGMRIKDLWPEEAARISFLDEEMRRTGRPIQTVESLEMEDGTHYWLMHKFPIPDGTGKLAVIGGMAIDITDRIVAEQKVEAALKKEEVLKREIHHRVKNNLQVVISLLYLQSAEITDQTAREALRECQSRTRSIALIYALLSESENLARIEFVQYVHQLAADLLSAYRASPDLIGVTINAEGVYLDVDAALPCGLILTELVSNSLKYAFPDGRKGQITIELRPEPGDLLKLTVTDNGIGLPGDFNLENARTMGCKLVRDLTRQLGGKLTCASDHGTEVTVVFRQDTDGNSRLGL
jgi:PAS domain S-box-containing protein